MSIQDTLQKNKPFTLSVFWVYLLIIILLCTVFLRIYQWKNTDRTIPLLSPAKNLVHLTKIEDIASYSQTRFSLPTNTFGSAVYAIGVYKDPTKEFPEGTLAFIYTKNQTRVAELDILPSGYLVEQKDHYHTYKQEVVQIQEPYDGLLIHLRNEFDCLAAKKNHPALCQITKLLFWKKGDALYQLSIDGRHLSEGEAIEWMRSIQK